MLDQPSFFDAFERLTPPVSWTAEETEHLFRLRAELGWDWRSIGSALGRTPSSAKSKFKATLHARAAKALPRPAEQARVPDAVLAEQARRLAALPRDLAGLVLGDPPRGFSALDKRGNA